MEFIDLKLQHRTYQGEIESAIAEVLGDGRYIMGLEIKELEDQLAGYVGVDHCITTSSGTDSLEIA